jgi:hypothetical protein
MQVRLDPEATRSLLQARCSYGQLRPGGARWGATYRLFTCEGSLRRSGPLAVGEWMTAVEAAAREQLVIYNGRSHRASRPVWWSEPKDRTLSNSGFSAVTLFLHSPTYHHEANLRYEALPGEVLTWG